MAGMIYGAHRSPTTSSPGQSVTAEVVTYSLPAEQVVQHIQDHLRRELGDDKLKVELL